MTRGQDSLVIDAADGGSTQLGVAALVSVDLSSFELPVIEPSTTELAAHAAMLVELDKASGGKLKWKALSS